MKKIISLTMAVALVLTMGLFAGTADAALEGELGILDLTANGGINPATGLPWQEGDQYRLAFLSSQATDATSSDINYYNMFVQALADAAGIGGIWKAIASTAAVHAKVNTNTDPIMEVGVSMYLLDGVTKIADNNADMWHGGLDNPLNLTDLGGDHTSVGRGNGDTWTGSSRTLGGPAANAEFGRSTVAYQWWMIYNAGLATKLPVYALSDPLSIISGEPDEYVDLIKFDGIGDGLGEDKTAGTHTFEVEIESEFEFIQVTTKAGRYEAVTQIGVGDDPVTDALGFVIELVSVEDGVYTVAVSSTEETPKALSYVILGAGKAEGEADPVLVGYEETEGYVVETGDNLHAKSPEKAGPKPKGAEAAAAAPQGPSQEVLAKKAALEEQKAEAADARFTRKRQHMLDLFGMGPDGMPLKGPR
jgi:hypothetical protein